MATSSTKVRQPYQLIDYASVVDPEGGGMFVKKAASLRKSRRSQAQQLSTQKSKQAASDPIRQKSKQAAIEAPAPARRQTPSQAAAVSSADSAAARLWEQTYRPAFLIFASAHVMATVCAVTGATQPQITLQQL